MNQTRGPRPGRFQFSIRSCFHVTTWVAFFCALGSMIGFGRFLMIAVFVVFPIAIALAWCAFVAYLYDRIARIPVIGKSFVLSLVAGGFSLLAASVAGILLVTLFLDAMTTLLRAFPQ